MTNIYSKDGKKIIGCQATSRRGDMKEYTGQSFNGDSVVYVPAVGICTVEKYDINDEKAVKVVDVKVTADRIKADVKAVLKGKKLALCTDNFSEKTISLYIMGDISERLTDRLTLNTNGNKTGLNTRWLTDSDYIANALYTVTINVDEYINTVKELPEKRHHENYGVLSEYVMLQSKKAFTDRQREIDGYFKDEKKRIPCELKTNFSGEMKIYLSNHGIGNADTTTDNSKSNANNLVSYTTDYELYVRKSTRKK